MLDLIYARTRLLRDAEAAGCTMADGGTMLLHQGAAAFTLWTGQPAPLDVMDEALADARAKGLRSAEGEPAEDAEPAEEPAAEPAEDPPRAPTPRTSGRDADRAQTGSGRAPWIASGSSRPARATAPCWAPWSRACPPASR